MQGMKRKLLLKREEKQPIERPSEALHEMQQN